MPQNTCKFAKAIWYGKVNMGYKDQWVPVVVVIDPKVRDYRVDHQTPTPWAGTHYRYRMTQGYLNSLVEPGNWVQLPMKDFQELYRCYAGEANNAPSNL